MKFVNLLKTKPAYNEHMNKTKNDYCFGSVELAPPFYPTVFQLSLNLLKRNLSKTKTCIKQKGIISFGSIEPAFVRLSNNSMNLGIKQKSVYNINQKSVATSSLAIKISTNNIR